MFYHILNFFSCDSKLRHRMSYGALITMGQLCQRAVYYLQRQDVLEELSDGPVGKDSIGDDWELI